MTALRRGDTAVAVAEIRNILTSLHLVSYRVDSDLVSFDAELELAVRAFQQRRGLVADGVVGPATYRVLRGALFSFGSRSLAHSISTPVHGDDVYALQARLAELGYDSGRPDAEFGPHTEQALRAFQRDVGLPEDGICGPSTVRVLRQLPPRTTGGDAVSLREAERVRRAGSRLTGKRIVVDPGHGGHDMGGTATGVHETHIVWDVARRLEGRIKATGAEALLSRGAGQNPSQQQRADLANETAADLSLSLHCEVNHSSQAQGVATFYFGSDTGARSTAGEHLAGLAQRELVARTGMTDCRTHPKRWDMLTRTRCPSVSVTLGYLSHDGDRQRICEPSFRDIAAEAVLVAVKRFYLLEEATITTGTFTMADVLRDELTNCE